MTGVSSIEPSDLDADGGIETVSLGLGHTEEESKVAAGGDVLGCFLEPPGEDSASSKRGTRLWRARVAASSGLAGELLVWVGIWNNGGRGGTYIVGSVGATLRSV